MKEVFKKILDSFSNIHRFVRTDEDLEWNRGVYRCSEIVRQVAGEYNGGWIPVEQMLPEKDDKYLVCIKSPTNYYNVTTSYFTNDLYDFDKYTFGRHKGKHKASFCDYSSGCGYYEVSNVVAWMPLPQPYVKGE